MLMVLLCLLCKFSRSPRLLPDPLQLCLQMIQGCRGAATRLKCLPALFPFSLMRLKIYLGTFPCITHRCLCCLCKCVLDKCICHFELLEPSVFVATVGAK